MADLKAQDIRLLNRAVAFTGDLGLVYRANLWLRTSTRVLLNITSFAANTYDDLYARTRSIHWDEFMDHSHSFAIHATVYSETFKNSLYVVQKVKDAIADFWRMKSNCRPDVDLINPQRLFEVHISHNKVDIWIDSSGHSLHKRGYKTAATYAPLNEALAAGLVLMSGWKGQHDLYDPMCGSGTILTEAALIARNIPPGIYRERFAFEQWNNYNHRLFENVRNDAHQEKDLNVKIYGSDASFYAIKTAMKNIESASFNSYIKLKQIRIEEWNKTISDSITLITNPPYGERLNKSQDITHLYKSLGSMLKHHFNNATAWILLPGTKISNSIGLRPDSKTSLLNGNIECTYNRYQLFEGKRNDYLAQNKKNHA